MDLPVAPLALTPEERSQKRSLILKDTTALLTLAGIAFVLFAATLLIFHSYERHREELASRWLLRGQQLLSTGHATAAIPALRTALVYAREERPVEILLAQALAEAGRTEEAAAYFNTLWETEPGNGIVNLQLARLARRQNRSSEALKSYRAAIYGTWEGDGTVRRREIRLELADYLLALHRDAEARNELLVVAGNAPEDPTVRLDIAQRMEHAGDPANALLLYQTLLARHPRDPQVLSGLGRTAYALGYVRKAQTYLERLLAEPAFPQLPNEQQEALRSLLADSIRLRQLNPSANLPPRERAQRILKIEQLAQKRLAVCVQTLSASPLPARWQQIPVGLTLMRLVQNSALEEQLLSLSLDTEATAAQLGCGSPTDEDRLLLQLAQHPEEVEAE